MPLKVLLSRGLGASLLVLLASPAVANAGMFFPEKGGSPNADKIWTLYLLIFVLASIVFIGVAGALVWALIKFRARKGAVAAQIHGNTRLEIGWTVGAFVIVVFITVFTFIVLPDIKNPPASDIDDDGNPVAAANVLYASTDQPDPPDGSASLNIKVDGQQYVWRYQYPMQDKTQRLLLRRHGRPRRHDRHAGHHGRRRRRTRGGSPSWAARWTPSRATRTRRGSRSPRARSPRATTRSSSPASAPSCAVATTPTCSPG